MRNKNKNDYEMGQPISNLLNHCTLLNQSKARMDTVPPYDDMTKIDSSKYNTKEVTPLKIFTF